MPFRNIRLPRLTVLAILISLFMPVRLNSFHASSVPFLSLQLSVNKLVLTVNCIQRRKFSASSSPSTFDLRDSMKLESPSAERNKLPIWNVLETKVLPLVQNCTDPAILEIAAGAGVHTQYFAKKLLHKYPDRTFCWYPSDTNLTCLTSIAQYIEDDSFLLDSDMVKPPVKLTLYEKGILEQEISDLYSSLSFDVIISINMIHISPWEATIGLMKVAGERLRSKTGLLLLYGPFKVNGTFTDSNRRFDSSLRQQNFRWGVRDVEMVVLQAEENRLLFVESIEMPANNLVLLFRAATSTSPGV